MIMAAAKLNEPARAEGPHIPVLLDQILAEIAPVSGDWLDGTFGAGGYARGLLDRGAASVIGVDRDPLALEMAEAWRAQYGDRLKLVAGEFGDLDDHARSVSYDALDGVVLDLGVSSMQLDLAERGFSFMRDGPLDMRMSQAGMSAEDLVNEAPEAHLADILYHYGEERAARRIARAIVAARKGARITTTAALAKIVEGCLPRPKPNQNHPATRSFQALRIAVNDELGQLVKGLLAAERILREGGILAVVTFHSLEDRAVKRFMQLRSDTGGGGSRHAPERARQTPSFLQNTRKAIAPSPEEAAQNPRARSAKLRLAVRSGEAAPAPLDFSALGLPPLEVT